MHPVECGLRMSEISSSLVRGNAVIAGHHYYIAAVLHIYHALIKTGKLNEPQSHCAFAGVRRTLEDVVALGGNLRPGQFSDNWIDYVSSKYWRRSIYQGSHAPGSASSASTRREFSMQHLHEILHNYMSPAFDDVEIGAMNLKRFTPLGVLSE